MDERLRIIAALAMAGSLAAGPARIAWADGEVGASSAAYLQLAQRAPENASNAPSPDDENVAETPMPQTGDESVQYAVAVAALANAAVAAIAASAFQSKRIHRGTS